MKCHHHTWFLLLIIWEIIMNQENKILKLTLSAVHASEEHPPNSAYFPPDFPTTVSQYGNKTKNMLSVDESNETKWGAIKTQVHWIWVIIEGEVSNRNFLCSYLFLFIFLLYSVHFFGLIPSAWDPRTIVGYHMLWRHFWGEEWTWNPEVPNMHVDPPQVIGPSWPFNVHALP